MSKIKFVVWDMGGVIYKWCAEPFYQWSMENSFNKEECLKNMKHFDFNPHMSGLQTNEEMAIKFCEFCYIPYDETVAEKIIKTMMDGNGPEFLTTQKSMEYVILKGAQNAMLSNASPSFGDAWRNEKVMKDERRFFSFDLKMVKPNLKIYEAVRDKLGIEFDEMIFVDDKKENVDAAISLGINGIVYDEATIENKIRKIL